MNKLLLSFCASTILLASCGDGTLSVDKYNQKAISIYNPLQLRMTNIENTMGDDKASATAAFASITKSVDSARTEIGKLKPCKDAQEMHTSMMALLDFEHDKMMPALNDLISKMDKPEEAQEAAKKLEPITAEATALETKMTTAQAAMAAKAGRKLN